MSNTFVIKISYKSASDKYYIGTISAKIKNVQSCFKYVLEFDFFCNSILEKRNPIELIRFSDESFESVVNQYKTKIEPQFLRWENYDEKFPKNANKCKSWSKNEEEKLIEEYTTTPIKELSVNYGRTETAIRNHVQILKNTNHELKNALTKKSNNPQTENSNMQWTVNDNKKIISLYTQNCQIDSIAKEVKRTENAVIHHLTSRINISYQINYPARKWTDEEIEEIKKNYLIHYNNVTNKNANIENSGSYIIPLEIDGKSITSLISEKFKINEFSLCKFLIKLNLYKIN